MTKEDYLKAIKVARGDNDMLLAINSKLAVDIRISSKDKQDIFKAITKAKK